MGEDARGDRVFIMSAKKYQDVIERAIESLLNVLHQPVNAIKVMTCAHENPQIVMLGKALAILRLFALEHYIVTKFARNRFTDIMKLVQEAKHQPN